jgi:hypothetical protein
MKVVAYVAALTLAMCSFAVAADPTNKTLDNTNTTNNAGEWNNANANNATNNTNANNNTTNPTNDNATNNAKTWNANNATNNANANNVNTVNNANSPTQQLLKVSQEGFAAIRAVRAARVAIFNGQPNVATEMLNKAKTNLDTASKDAPLFVANTEATVNGTVVADAMTVGAMNWIPIDGQVLLADTYVASPQNTEHIQKANEHFKNGESKEAIEELKLAEIDVTCTRVMMPLAATAKCVAEAAKLVAEQKYYEANLVLKTAEDGLVVKSASLLEMPQVKTQTDNKTN